jgi:DNA primase
VSAYSPRIRPGVPVSFPLGWDEVGRVSPGDFTIHNAAQLAAERPSWLDLLPRAQRLPARLVEAGAAIPPGRVQAMHEGRRRVRATRETP